MTKRRIGMRLRTPAVLLGIALLVAIGIVSTQVAQGSGPKPPIVVPPCCGGTTISSSVAPNPGIYFSSSTNGVWIAGQDPDVNAIGYTGGGGSTPGDAINVTTDGGQTWTNTLSDSNGLFGLDFVNATVGWAPGALALYQTTDGGNTWTAISSNETNPFIQVDFQSTTSGFGIDMAGQVWTTTDGGVTWTQDNNLPTTSSLCLATSVIYAAELDGTVQTSSDGGTTWANSYSFEGATSGEDMPSTLECNGSTANVDFSSQNGTENGIEFEDVATTSSGSSWNVVENTTSSISDPITSTTDAGEGPAIVKSDGSIVDVTYQVGFGAVTLNTFTGTPPSITNQTAIALTSTNLPNSSIADQLSWTTTPVYSMTFADSQDGWFAASLSSDTNGTFASVIYSTTDGGVTWSPIYSTPVYDF